MKLFIDTNLWLRFFMRDYEEHYVLVEKILQLHDASQVSLATSTFVLSEFVYTETTHYKINRVNILEDLRSILSIKNLKIVEKTDIHKTITHFSERNRKWSDCIIVSQVPKNYKLCSFDKRLEKVIGKKRFTAPDKTLFS